MSHHCCQIAIYHSHRVIPMTPSTATRQACISVNNPRPRGHLSAVLGVVKFNESRRDGVSSVQCLRDRDGIGTCFDRGRGEPSKKTVRRNHLVVEDRLVSPDQQQQPADQTRENSNRFNQQGVTQRLHIRVLHGSGSGIIPRESRGISAGSGLHFLEIPR